VRGKGRARFAKRRKAFTPASSLAQYPCGVQPATLTGVKTIHLLGHLLTSSQRLVVQLASPLTRLLRPAPDARRVAVLAEIIAAERSLWTWLLVIASEPPRVRRALLARGAQELRVTLQNPVASDAIAQLADAPLLHAVITVLFRRHSLPPLTAEQRTGRHARVRLAQLGEHLLADRSASLAA
jgi:hypothetical protein